MDEINANLDSVAREQGSVDVDPEHRLDESPPRASELIALCTIVGIADLAIYRGQGGYSGWAAVIGATPILLLWGTARRHPSVSLVPLGLMVALAAAKLVWCGSAIASTVGLALLPLFAISLAGRRPYLLDALSFLASAPSFGFHGLAVYGRQVLRFGRRFPSSVIVVLLPAAIGLAFSVLFVLANPDLVNAVSGELSKAAENVRKILADISPFEIMFLTCVFWVTVGFLRPRLTGTSNAAFESETVRVPPYERAEPAPRPLYLAWRNSLFVVILIYALYLVFEFRTLWFRQFPKGFYFSGYAHEGAAWLTIGLALATSILSLIFRGRILGDACVNRLRWLASIWSIENLLLAAAVYNRLFIYIGFNGMTRMRIVGLYGVSAVLIGFLLVLLKILRNQDFVWLMQRHLWTLGLAIYLYAITPVDALAMRYNIDRILAGNLAPSVQISEHPISSEGLLFLSPLLDGPDEIVRTGIVALLDDRRIEIQSQQNGPWTTFQLADAVFLERFRTRPAGSAAFSDATHRRAAWERFRRYAYQWY